MKNISQKLSSLTLTTWTLVVLLLWFIIGILFVRMDSLADEFRLMNGTLVRHWLLSAEDGSNVLKFWFVGLCLVMIVLGVNLVFCSWTKILKIIRIRFSGPKFFMLIVHVLFGLVALGHLGTYMLGYKKAQVRLQEGAKFEFGDGYSVQLVGVHFVDDVEVLKKTRRQLRPGDLSYDDNFAEIAISQNGKEIQRGRIYTMKPMRQKDIHVVLRTFTAPRSQDNQQPGKGKLGVMLSISRNPVLDVFLVLYPIMILGIAIHLVMTWRTSAHEAFKS